MALKPHPHLTLLLLLLTIATGVKGQVQCPGDPSVFDPATRPPMGMEELPIRVANPDPSLPPIIKPSKYVIWNTSTVPSPPQPPDWPTSIISAIEFCRNRCLEPAGIRHWEDWAYIHNYISSFPSPLQLNQILATGIRYRVREGLFLNDLETSPQFKPAFLVWEGDTPINPTGKMYPAAPPTTAKSVYLAFQAYGNAAQRPNFLVARDEKITLTPPLSFFPFCQYHRSTTKYTTSYEEQINRGPQRKQKKVAQVVWTSRAAVYMTNLPVTHYEAKKTLCPSVRVGSILGKLWDGEESDPKKVIWKDDLERKFLSEKIMEALWSRAKNVGNVAPTTAFYRSSNPAKKLLRTTALKLGSDAWNAFPQDQYQVHKDSDAFAICVVEFVKHCL